MSITICPNCEKELSPDPAEGIYCEHCGSNITRQYDEREPTYSIYRFYAEDYSRKLIKSHVSLEEAQDHCNDPETSWRTATSIDAKVETKEMGPWFDGYEHD